MATKAEQLRAMVLSERAQQNATARRRAGHGTTAENSKAHNLSARAGRTARVSYEESAGRPSRKSTRGSEHHQRASNRLERTRQLAQSAPENRARLARARSAKVRGKP